MSLLSTGLVRNFVFVLVALILTAGRAACAAPEDLPDGLYAEFVTPHGSIVCELYYQRVPLVVTNFVGLAEGTLAQRNGRPFYTGLKWYRVVPNFVAQSGDPTFAPNKPDDDAGHPYSFPDEFSPGLHHDAAGVLSMANAGPDTNSSEFFITLRDTQRLNYLHSVFGRVVRGLDALKQIKQGDPIVAIRIVRVGAAAKAFNADRAAFDGLVAHAKKYSGVAEPGPTAHFDDPDHLLPSDVPRAKNFNFKLANFERATGIKVYARVYAKFVQEKPDQKPGSFAGALARKLSLAQDGVLAVYFADLDQWTLWIGDRYVNAFMGRAGTVAEFMQDKSFHHAKQSFFAEAQKQAVIYTHETEVAAPDKPITPAQKIKYTTDAVLDALIFKFEPKP